MSGCAQEAPSVKVPGIALTPFGGEWIAPTMLLSGFLTCKLQVLGSTDCENLRSALPGFLYLFVVLCTNTD